MIQFQQMHRSHSEDASAFSSQPRNSRENVGPDGDLENGEEYVFIASGMGGRSNERRSGRPTIPRQKLVIVYRQSKVKMTLVRAVAQVVPGQMTGSFFSLRYWVSAASNQ